MRMRVGASVLCVVVCVVGVWCCVARVLRVGLSRLVVRWLCVARCALVVCCVCDVCCVRVCSHPC